VDTFSALMNGFAIAMQPENLLFAIIGCILGTLVGVLPGIGPASAIAMLIPITLTLPPTPAIIMIASIYYGGMYGGTITSVLVNVPGEAASAVTCLDGYQMAKKGRAGPALFVAAVGSFIGGNFATLCLVVLAVPLTDMALKFGPPEFFALMFVGLSFITSLAGTSLVRALIAAILGLLIAMVGIDPTAGVPRFTFDQTQLLAGIDIVPVAMGIFGVSEILLNAESEVVEVIETKFRDVWMTRQDWKDSAWPIIRGTGIGTALGLVPGIGHVVPTFISYAVEKKLSRYPEKFGTGVIEGVAAPETANNAHANAAFIPLFTLGIPGGAAMAIVAGALMMNGLAPGPFLFREHPDFVWAVIASFYTGNLILLILNLPLIPLWVRILKIPYSVLITLILAFCVIGAYSLNNSVFDVGAMMGFGILGYFFKKLDYPAAPMVLTVILGPMMERGLRQSMEISDGSITVLFTRPISGTLMAIGILFILATCFRMATKAKARADSEA
jgi:putative tricarboxylic transport membrane protein